MCLSATEVGCLASVAVPTAVARGGLLAPTARDLRPTPGPVGIGRRLADVPGPVDFGPIVRGSPPPAIAPTTFCQALPASPAARISSVVPPCSVETVAVMAPVVV